MTAHIVIWRDAVLVLAAAPLAYYALGTLVALRFFRRERARTLPNYTSPASILKPVRGVDFGSYENFASFCRQEYPDYEILFAVNDGEDPAVPVIQRIIAEFPERRIRLLVGAEHLGANRKVNKLARLAREAVPHPWERVARAAPRRFWRGRNGLCGWPARLQRGARTRYGRRHRPLGPRRCRHLLQRGSG